MRTESIIVLLQAIQFVSSFVNLSVNKSADMSTSQYSDKWLADEAMDGDVSQDVQDNSCSVTMYGFFPEAWWRVDLGDVYEVNSVRIYNRREIPPVTYKLSGFSLYVSATSTWENGVLCYLDNNGDQYNPGPSDVLTVPCNATGRYVTVCKQRHENTCQDPNQPQFCAQLELCEVQVFGCENGTYGASCGNTCSGFCLNGNICNKTHGGCENGCTAGYRGFRCDITCNPGFFGLNCSRSCGNCFNSSCNNLDGSCRYGCSAGWKGFYCNETCNSGVFGVKCSSTCGNCLNSSCNNVDGSCPNGCITGWKGFYCSESCENNTYGASCENNCSNNCLNGETCNKTHGGCDSGCAAGYSGFRCDKACSAGFFGLNCSGSCGKCFNSSCSKVDGSCPYGCKAGWKGFYCNETCDDGEYGPGCSDKCNEHCFEGLCDAIYGTCHFGCIDGWTGDLCNEGSRRGFFGPNCSKSCLECSESCHHQTGECLGVCRDITSSANNSNNSVIILIITNVLTVIALVTSVFLLCRHIRKSTNNSPGLQTQQDTSTSPVLPANRSGTAYQPGTGKGSTGNTENRTYEGLRMNSTDTNTYDVLQTERNVTYTNTQLI